MGGKFCQSAKKRLQKFPVAKILIGCPEKGWFEEDILIFHREASDLLNRVQLAGQYEYHISDIERHY